MFASRWSPLLIVAAVTLPALLRRSMPDAPVLPALLYALLMALAVGAARVVLPWERWCIEAARAAGVVFLLAAIWDLRSPGDRLDPVASALAPLLVGAVVEEIIFRGALPALVAPRAAMLVSSVAFGVAHPVAPVGHAAAGALFFLLRGRDGSLVAPVLAHLAYNGAVLVAMK